MATDKLTVYNSSLIHIGERRLASLTEAREPRRVLDDVWTKEVTNCLEAGQWNFAVRSIEAQDTASVEPLFGFAYAFEKPTDWLRTIGFSASERFDPPLNSYMDEASYWYSDVTPLYVRYISDDTSYGFDLSLWTGRFARYVEYHIASVICERLTQNSSKGEELRKKAQRALSDAKSTDAMNEAVAFPPTGSWVRSRGGGRSISRNPYRA